MAVHLAREHVVYLFVSGRTEGLLDGETAERTSCCNHGSEPCRKSFDNNANYNSFAFPFSARWDTLVEEWKVVRLGHKGRIWPLKTTWGDGIMVGVKETHQGHLKELKCPM